MEIFFHIFDLIFKSSYQIVSLFHMYIDMGERVAGKQDRPSLIIVHWSGPLKLDLILILVNFVCVLG